VLRFNYLSTDQDRREWVEAIRVARTILGQPALAEFDGGETSPGPSVQTNDQILDWVARDGETALHPSCTARMGVDELSVLDPLSLRVHGVDGLRVVDASAMPYITNGNIYAPVMMLAEKAADLVRGDTPLPPDPIPFYRHGISPPPVVPDPPAIPVHLAGEGAATGDVVAAVDGAAGVDVEERRWRTFQTSR
jgi:choline dehydrogenase